MHTRGGNENWTRNSNKEKGGDKFTDVHRFEDAVQTYVREMLECELDTASRIMIEIR
jgi:hypothetical protein